ncbi:Hypothetical protein ETEE_0121 [Edwardsiella anguillarum ET080813]|uniref:Uncharacterized protein n=1 Tax=Edwardsiella anguillarum ET080813 TaxID=667120 RepID=A0A076LEJ3_9GAMM|nr:Hypothetical protein ETEE_0121 [Edwardsiella anguillarum ET080813]
MSWYSTTTIGGAPGVTPLPASFPPAIKKPAPKARGVKAKIKQTVKNNVSE